MQRASRRAGPTAGAPVAEIVPHRGAPAISINGRIVPPLMLDLHRNSPPELVSDCARAGAHLFRLRDAGLGWYPEDRFQYDDLDGRIAGLVAGDPDACFIIEAIVDPPEWWRRAYPDECADYLLRTGERRGAAVSWASERWREECGAALSRLIRHVHGGAAGERCAGWQIACGANGEWRYPHADDLPDSGPPMTMRFRQWAGGRYRRNTMLLRQAWFDARAEFRAIAVPGAAERRRADMGVLRNPARSRRILDYYECVADAQNSAALHFCAVARAACNRRAIVGISYGLIPGCGPEPEDGQSMPEPLLDSEDVQFFLFTASGDGTYSRGLIGSAAMRGKLCVHAAPPNGSARQAGAIALTGHLGLALPASTPGPDLAPIQSAMARALLQTAESRHAIRPIAVIVDCPNRTYVVNRGAPGVSLNTALLDEQIAELAHIGAPYDLRTLSDVFEPQFPDYPVVLFLNTFYISDAERRRIDARLKRKGTIIAWLWGAGTIGETGIDAANATRLTGQKHRLEPGEISERIRITEGNDPITWSIRPGAALGGERTLNPVITVADKQAVRLGANSANKTVFAVRRMADWTSVVIGAPFAPAALLRNILREAGVHLYTDCADAIVHADSRSVAIECDREQALTISLPGRFDVVEGWTGAGIARGKTEFHTIARPGETLYFEFTRTVRAGGAT